MATGIDPLRHRMGDHGVDPMFLRRWSQRALTGEPLPDGALMAMLEAARWAPSSYNGQPWRFRYALRGGPHFEAFLSVLKETNRLWCAQAGALLAVVSRTVDDDGDAIPTHALDAGLALENLLLQGSLMGLAAHALAGFDREAARGAQEQLRKSSWAENRTPGKGGVVFWGILALVVVVLLAIISRLLPKASQPGQ